MLPFLNIELLDKRQGIVHIIGPEQGFTLPGTTIVCGDSHTSTHGAFGSLAFGIGTSDGEHYSLYEPIHGSAPDIAGCNIANPLAAILSVAMMFNHSFKLNNEARMIQTAVTTILDEGFRTEDIMTSEGILLSTTEMGDKVIEQLDFTRDDQ